MRRILESVRRGREREICFCKASTLQQGIYASVAGGRKHHAACNGCSTGLRGAPPAKNESLQNFL